MLSRLDEYWSARSRAEARTCSLRYRKDKMFLKKFILFNTFESFQQLLDIRIKAVNVWNYKEFLSNFELIRNKPGVYGIYNTVTSKVYIGR